MHCLHSQRGFTLIELIVVIVLLGIMATGAGYLISTPIKAYDDQLRRQQLVDSVEMALHKIETDIHSALPNSVRVIDNGPDSWVLELVSTVDGARYRDEAGGGYSAASEILSFTSAVGDQQFNLLGTLPNLSPASYPQTFANYRVVIYNTSPGQIYSDAALANNPGIVSPAGLTLNIDSAGIEHEITLASAFRFKYQSPTQRLFIIDDAVSYICDRNSGSLTRYHGYGFVQNQADIDSTAKLQGQGAQSAVVARQISGCSIDYQPGSPWRSGLISLQVSLTDSANESVRLLHQVHVDNVP